MTFKAYDCNKSFDPITKYAFMNQFLFFSVINYWSTNSLSFNMQ